MKRILFIGAFLILTCSIFSQVEWQIDNAHSNVTFAIQWRQNSFRTGEFKIFSGTIKAKNESNFEDANVNFSTEASSIDLIARNLSTMVEGQEYIDVQNFSEILFVSTSVKKEHKNTYNVKGNLTIKGVTHEVIFLMEDNGIIEYEGRKYGALKVTGQLKKSDFKIYGGGDRLGDIINITAYFETVKVEN
jgi:polyisoprenoid-binding protein YceI